LKAPKQDPKKTKKTKGEYKMIFDSHAHYDDKAFDEDRENVFDKIQKTGVTRVLNCGADIASCERTIELTRKYEFIYGAIGIHPENAGEVVENLNKIGDMLNNNKIVALGEIGLDYYYEGFDRKIQLEAFRAQMDMARSLNLPVVIHDRDAHEDTLAIIKEFKGVRGVLHCFSGSVEYAMGILKHDYYIGFTGVITFKNARKAIEVLSMMPANRILAETDCPYMAPVPHRGERCDSSLLTFTISKIAEIKSMDFESAAALTYDNAGMLFGI
jgi:TatD DNase family protein